MYQKLSAQDTGLAPLLRKPTIKNLFGWKSNTSVDNALRAGLLPKPVKISERCWGLPSDEVDVVLKAKVAGQTDEQIKSLVKRLEVARTAAFERLAA